jgi:hypothetical protein
METTVAIAIISAFTSILGAAVSFFFSMRKEREADGEKSSLSITASSWPLFRVSLARTRPLKGTSVNALHNFRNETAVSNPNRSQKKHDELLSVLIRNIRTDLGISPASNPADLSIRLWLSGVDLEALSRSAEDVRQEKFASDTEVKAVFDRYWRR